MNYIKLINASKTYNVGLDNAINALKNINLEINKGETVSIQGVSGSGKSTLLHILGCLDSLTAGEYYFAGDKINFSNSDKISELRNKKIGFILQQFGLILDRRVIENIMLPQIFMGVSLKKAEIAAKMTAEALGIEKLLNKVTAKLSGGEKQRVAIARAIVNNPDLILADEPTGALDSETGKKISDILVRMADEGKTVIIVTHDISVANMCRRRLKLTDGIISEID